MGWPQLPRNRVPPQFWRVASWHSWPLQGFFLTEMLNSYRGFEMFEFRIFWCQSVDVYLWIFGSFWMANFRFHDKLPGESMTTKVFLDFLDSDLPSKKLYNKSPPKKMMPGRWWFLFERYHRIPVASSCEVLVRGNYVLLKIGWPQFTGSEAAKLSRKADDGA